MNISCHHRFPVLADRLKLEHSAEWAAFDFRCYRRTRSTSSAAHPAGVQKIPTKSSVAASAIACRRKQGKGIARGPVRIRRKKIGTQHQFLEADLVRPCVGRSGNGGLLPR